MSSLLVAFNTLYLVALNTLYLVAFNTVYGDVKVPNHCLMLFWEDRQLIVFTWGSRMCYIDCNQVSILPLEVALNAV